MTTPLENIQHRAALRLAKRFFVSGSVFMPRVGEPIACRAYPAREGELQPVGYDQVADIKKRTVIYLKDEISDDLIETESYFTIDGVKYYVDATTETDGNILGRVVVRDES